MRVIHKKHIFILLGLVILVLAFLFLNYQADKIYSSQTVTFGVSYSPNYASELGLDPKKTYLSILDDLKVKNIRLSAYWDEIEPKKDEFDFTDLDWYVSEAEKHNTKVILAVGYKLPRWPECRAPGWLDNTNQSMLRQRQLIMIEESVKHFDSNPAVSTIQVENEALFNFGICPVVDLKFLADEVRMVKTLTSKPIIITDAGELSFWINAMRLGDIFGTTLYRVVDAPILGQFHYPFRPYVYRVRSDLFRTLFAKNSQKTIISELQAEGWAGQPLKYVPIENQVKNFTVDQFRENVNFARKTGFTEAYLWGVEWWYYLKLNGYPEYLDYAKSLF